MRELTHSCGLYYLKTIIIALMIFWIACLSLMISVRSNQIASEMIVVLVVSSKETKVKIYQLNTFIYRLTMLFLGFNTL